MKDTLKQNLKQARPTLHSVAPLTYSICWGYAITNILLGTGMFFLYDPKAEIAVANILSYQMWGMIFVLFGALAVYSLLTNNWKVTKNLQFAGLCVKAIWAIALIIRCISEPQTIVITVIWFFFAYIQAMTYIYFIPKTENNGG